MAKNQKMDAAEAQRMCEVDVRGFLTAVTGKLTLTSEEKKASKTRVSAIKLDDPETQKALEPLLEIAVQADTWESKNELKAIWIKGSFMQVAENIFSYRRVKGGVSGGVRGVLKALDWGKSQAYKAKDLVETFEDQLLEMPIGINAVKLLALIEKQKQDRKHGKVFDPVAWLDEHKDALRDAKSGDAVKEMLGTVKEKKAPKNKTVETEVDPDPSVEEITVANISAKVKRYEDTGLSDVVMKSLSDMQVEALKRWLSFQEVRDEDKSESVPPPDTFDADPVQEDALKDEIPASFKYLVERAVAKGGQECTALPGNWVTWNMFGWDKDLIDLMIENWDILELEEKRPLTPDVEFILEYSGLCKQAANKILQDRLQDPIAKAF